VRIAVCSLSEFTHVSEFLDAAVYLGERHSVRFFPGFARPAATALLDGRGLAQLPCIAEGAAPEPADPVSLGSAAALFERYFLAHAEAVLPRLLSALQAFRPDLVLAHLRDYAGVAAAELLGVPLVSFGSHASPVRREEVDAPFGAPLDRDAPAGLRRLLWDLQRDFDARVDRIHNERIRRPHGLPDVEGTATLHSGRLVILSLIPALSSKRSPEPAFVRHVGPLFSRRGGSAGQAEAALLERIASSPRPRVFLSLGTTYVSRLMEPCLGALADFPGTLVTSGGGRVLQAPAPMAGRLYAPFIADVDAVLEHVDAVVTVGAGKSVVEALAHGCPLVCLPQQGEQWEIALAVRSLGAGAVPCRGRFDPVAFARSTLEVATDSAYASSARTLSKELARSGGGREAAEAVEGLFGAGSPL
jgi:UDP:flavonoid glycosyltransferase YjiC (YdhE family)